MTFGIVGTFLFCILCMIFLLFLLKYPILLFFNIFFMLETIFSLFLTQSHLHGIYGYHTNQILPTNPANNNNNDNTDDQTDEIPLTQMELSKLYTFKWCIDHTPIKYKNNHLKQIITDLKNNCNENNVNFKQIFFSNISKKQYPKRIKDNLWIQSIVVCLFYLIYLKPMLNIIIIEKNETMLENEKKCLKMIIVTTKIDIDNNDVDDNDEKSESNIDQTFQHLN